MNQRFEPHGFAFKLTETTRTKNPNWNNVASGSPTELAFKSQLRKGTYKDLNLYFTKIASPKGEIVDGYAYVDCYPLYFIQSLSRVIVSFVLIFDSDSTFPAEILSDGIFKVDGVVIHPATAPGGNNPNYGQGMTAVHEVRSDFSLFAKSPPNTRRFTQQ
jgi:hypothetical protein